MIPTCSPSADTTRTRGTRMRSLTRGSVAIRFSFRRPARLVCADDRSRPRAKPGDARGRRHRMRPFPGRVDRPAGDNATPLPPDPPSQKTRDRAGREVERPSWPLLGDTAVKSEYNHDHSERRGAARRGAGGESAPAHRGQARLGAAGAGGPAGSRRLPDPGFGRFVPARWAQRARAGCGRAAICVSGLSTSGTG